MVQTPWSVEEMKNSSGFVGCLHQTVSDLLWERFFVPQFMV